RYSRHLERLAAQWIGGDNSALSVASQQRDHREIGMNIAFTASPKPVLVKTICPWIEEAQHYIFFNNTCRRNCDEYRQMISAHTTEVGCTMGRRDNVMSEWPNPQYVTVCLYRPR
ncbi:GLIPR1-like protein 1, partial [Taenia solium]